jgi:hypothetical protein
VKTLDKAGADARCATGYEGHLALQAGVDRVSHRSAPTISTGAILEGAQDLQRLAQTAGQPRDNH